MDEVGLLEAGVGHETGVGHRAMKGKAGVRHIVQAARARWLSQGCATVRATNGGLCSMNGTGDYVQLTLDPSSYSGILLFACLLGFVLGVWVVVSGRRARVR